MILRMSVVLNGDPVVDSDTLSVCNFFARFSDVISRETNGGDMKSWLFCQATVTDTGVITKVKVNCVVTSVDSIEIQLLTPLIG